VRFCQKFHVPSTLWRAPRQARKWMRVTCDRTRRETVREMDGRKARLRWLRARILGARGTLELGCMPISPGNRHRVQWDKGFVTAKSGHRHVNQPSPRHRPLPGCRPILPRPLQLSPVRFPALATMARHSPSASPVASLRHPAGPL
jgi:hypothetical protein